MKKKLLLYVVTVLSLIIILGCVVKASSREENKNNTYYKYYTQYYIEHGDTLYDIAEKHMEEYPCDKEVYSTKEYAEEIAEVNNLGSTKIIAGQHLIIPYLEEELK